MKPIFLAFFSILLFASCSSDSNNSSVSFFNLNQGNLWVYKRYFSNDNVNFTFSNEIDSVRVVGDTLINSLTYAKLVHSNFNGPHKEFLRVDTDGHLVNENGLVIHSGTDIEYQHVRPYLVGGIVNIGTISEQLQDPFITNIEGTDYFVYSYYGTFVPNDSQFPSSNLFYQYTEGIGLVCQHIPEAAGYSCFEDRLIYFELN